MTRLVLSSLRAIGVRRRGGLRRERPPPARCRRHQGRQACAQIGREGGGVQAIAGRDLRRLERLRRRSRQGTHLLHPRPAEIARTREPDPRSGLCVHLRPSVGRGAQRSVLHHGLRRRGGDDTPNQRPTPSRVRSLEVGRQIEDVRRAAAPVALVDQASFEMLPKGGNLWVKNAAKESALIAEMRKGAKLVIKAASLRGHQSIDTYSLAASPRRWSGCRRNARGSDARVEAPGLGIESDYRPSRQRGGSVWDFLARGCFALETPEKGGWISLDFLGFSRQNRDLSMGYTG